MSRTLHPLIMKGAVSLTLARHTTRRRTSPDKHVHYEYELDVRDGGTVTFQISYMKIDDIVTILDVREQALAEYRAA
jgi:hypothetical protein